MIPNEKLNSIQIETTLLKNLMKEEGLNTQGLYFENVRDMNFAQQKKMHELRQKAKVRAAEIMNLFCASI